MKGIIFIHFLDMVETEFGDEVLDDIIEQCDLPSEGAYTSVGYYSHEEIVDLTTALSNRVNISIPDLLAAFGSFLFGGLYKSAPQIVKFADNAFDLMANIESVIHTDVKKLYPDAELPTFNILSHSTQKLEMVYTSTRHFDDLTEGLIKGCLAYFKENATVSRFPHPQGVLFVIEK